MQASDELGHADIQAVTRLSRILGLFNVDRTELVTVDVASALGLNRTTTHRYLTSMTTVGLLEPGSRNSSFVVGPLATKLGAMATGSAGVLAIAPRPMAALSDELRATVTLSLWASTGPMVVHVAEPRIAEAVLTVRLGTVLSVDAAQGVLFAAFLPREATRIDAQRERLRPAARAAFDEHVEEARRTGLSVVRHRDVGVVAVAAPVFDATGLCASLAVVGLGGTTTDAAVPERSRRVRETADQLTADLGGEVREFRLGIS
ncbi:IclR family transcriptional regulator domain-containing protein [Microbispora sp. CA-102843]|uniref:IclR family transcriptional regulator domain-containing protein n=1 Tax=Microbispora sp. CA-102843 TaxID=3239952 RepID=UPI003D8AA541